VYNLLLVKFIVLVFFVCLLSDAKAQTGKVRGKVTVEETQETLPGVSVYIESLDRGAVTNTEGIYNIISLPPGTYKLRFSFVGFKTIIVENVKVFSGQTTTIDAKMQEQAVEGEELIVQAERPLVQKDKTSSVSYVKQETIEDLPVVEVSDLIRFQPGVVQNSDGGFNFRGGRTREVAYVVDGIPVQNVYSQSGGNSVNVELQSVDELQVLTGTFDAELGGAQSGVVNLTTRSPSDDFQVSGFFRTGGFYAGSNDIFIDGNSFNPIESKDMSVTLSGPIIKKDDKLGFFVTGRFNDRVGHLKGKRRFTIQDGLEFDAYRFWYRSRFNPDDSRMIAMDNPVDPDGNPIFGSNDEPIELASGNGEIVNMDWNESLTLNPKLEYNLNGRTKITYSAIYNNIEGQNFNTSKRFSPDGRRVNDENNLLQILSLKRSFGDNLFLNLRGSYKFSRIESAAFDNFGDERYQFFSDRDPNTGLFLGGTENGRSRFEEDQIIASGDVTWQINGKNEIKTGFQYRSNKFLNKDSSIGFVRADNPDELANNVRPPDAASFEFFDQYLEAVQQINLEQVVRREITGESRVFEQNPVEFAAFLQDKVEVGSNIILKLGLRYEYYDTGEPFIENTRQQSELIGRSDNLQEADPKNYLSPRVVISFPISDKGAFRVAYGHFTQMPAYNRMFQNPVDANTNQGRLRGTTVGNPNLKPERTVKYELGLQQELTDFMGLDVNLYYKNVRNLLGLEILSTSDGVEYFQTTNRDFGIIKGSTISLVMRPQGFIQNSGFDITYEDAGGSSSNPNFIADVIVAGRAGEVGEVVVDRQIIPLDWNQSLTTNAYMTVGKKDNWNAGFIFQMATGQPFTPTFISLEKDFPDNFFDNSENKPLQLSLDLTASKNIELGPVQATLELQANNIINHLNEIRVNSVSGSAGQIVRLPENQLERSNVNEFVGLFSDETDDLRPSWYSSPRQFLLSIQFQL